MSLGAQKVLQDAQDYYNYACNSDAHREYIQRANLYLSYRDGDTMSPDLQADLKSIDARYFSTNRIEPQINNLTSLQIEARKSIDFKVNSRFSRHTQIANNLKQYWYIFQQRNNYQNQATDKFKDSLVTGMGLAKISADPKTGNLIYEQFDSREGIRDPDDRTPRFSNSYFTGRQYYIHAVEAKIHWPKWADYIDNLVDANTVSSVVMEQAYSFEDTNSPWVLGRTLKVVEIYYKKNDKCYKVLTEFVPDEGDLEQDIIESYFYTFDKDLAEAKKKPDSEIEEVNCTKIFKTVFTSDCLLEHGAIEAQVPNQQFFPIIPICISRDRFGYPYGMVKNLMSQNDSGDYLWSQYLHALNQKLLLITGTGVDIEKSGAEMIKQMRSKYGVIGVNATDVKVITNEKSLAHLEKAMNRVDIDVQQITQLYDENKGKQTNAQSGIGMEIRKTTSREMQNVYGMIYDYMLWSEGQLLLDTIKGMKNLNLQFYYLANQEMQHARIDNEISMLDFQIFQDTAPNFISSSEETSTKLLEIIKAGAAPLVLGHEYFAEKVGGLDKKDATESVRAFMEVANPAAAGMDNNGNNQL